MMIEEEIQQIYSGLGIGREVLEFGARIEKNLRTAFWQSTAGRSIIS